MLVSFFLKVLGRKCLLREGCKINQNSRIEVSRDRRNNKIKSIHSSLKNEANSLTIGESAMIVIDSETGKYEKIEVQCKLGYTVYTASAKEVGESKD